MKILQLFLLAILIVSCNDQEARKPIQVRSGSFYKESVERNKKILAAEELQIKKLIKKDTANQYLASKTGFWYHYDSIVQNDTYTPQLKDLVSFTYSISDINGTPIYTKKEIDTLKSKVDKQDFAGLREAIKLLKKGEKATFLFPSAIAYGYHGDQNKIGTNIPIITSITIFDIIKYQDSILE